MPRLLSFPALVLAAALLAFTPARGEDENGATQVLKWKDGKKAVFILSFDDSASSQLKNVVPELEKRKLVGTFYLVPGGGTHASQKAKWEEAAKSPYVVVANHTFTHKGVKSVEELEPELAKCNEVLLALHPARKVPRLIAFGRPGGVPWDVTEEQQQAALEKQHLVNRPPFAGSPIHYKSQEEVLALVDKALARGDMAHCDFHGVGGDWLVTPLEWFTALLDKLDAQRAEVWTTDMISWHQYVKEREGASVKTAEATPERIRVELTTKTDPALYDEPLTLLTKVPAAWTKCVVAQGTLSATVPVQNGVAQYDALPGAEAITLTPGQ